MSRNTSAIYCWNDELIYLGSLINKDVGKKANGKANGWQHPRGRQGGHYNLAMQNISFCWIFEASFDMKIRIFLNQAVFLNSFVHCGNPKIEIMKKCQ